MPEEEARGLLKDDGTTPPSSCNACCILRGMLCFVLVLALLGGAGAGFIMSVLARCQAASFFCVCVFSYWKDGVFRRTSNQLIGTTVV